MARKLDLSPLEPLFTAGKDFEIPEEEYEKTIKATLLKTKEYLRAKPRLQNQQKTGTCIVLTFY